MGDPYRDQLELAQVRAAEARARLERPTGDAPPPLARVHELEREVAALEQAVASTTAHLQTLHANEQEGVALHSLAWAFPLLVPALLAAGVAWNAAHLTGHSVAAWLVTAVTCLEVALVVYRHRPPRRPRAVRQRAG